MIRPATLAELRERGAPLIAAAARATGSPGRVQWQHLEALERIGWLVLLVAEEDGELVGECCATLAGEFWSEERTCTTLSLYVRSARHMRPMLEALQAVASDAGASLRLQVLPGTSLERLVRRMGMRAESVAYR